MFKGADTLLNTAKANSIKLVALDIDGTITEEDQTIDINTILALQKLKHNNPSTVVSLVSGNTLPVMVGIRNTIGVGDILFAENGGIMMSYLERTPSNLDCLEKNNLLTLSRGNIVKRANILRFFNRILPEKELEKIKKSHDVHEFFTNKWRETSLSIEIDRDIVPDIIANAGEALLQNSGYAIHIMNPGQNKGFALTTMMAFLNITAKEILACGDGGNDLDMFKVAEYSGTPNNASEEAKKHATYVSDKNNGSGLIDILSHYSLL